MLISMNPSDNKPVNGATGPSPSVNTSQPPQSTPGIVDQQPLQSRNLAKTFGKYNSIKGMIFSVIFFVVVVTLAIIIYHKTHSSRALVYLIGLFGGGAVVLFIVSYIGYRQLKHSSDNNSQFNQFQTSTAVTYSQPKGFAPAEVLADEKILNWFGPVMRTGHGASSYIVINKEVDKQTENTLLFTNRQIIGLMLGPEDTSSVQTPSKVGGLLNQAINLAPETAIQKTTQFEALNTSKWPQMVQSLTAQPFATILAKHLNVGIPYGDIDHIEFKTGLINPGLHIFLKNGNKLNYSTFKSGRIAEVQTTLAPLVKIVN